MLSHLNIKNIAIIDQATVEFTNGFNVLTGETAAGKSILIDSINMVLGERTSRDLIRHGTDKATVEALFTLNNRSLLDELGIDSEDNTILLKREITADGRSVCRINGQLATASMLKDAARGLINIHGQHDSQQLLIPSKHVDFLDRYADCQKEKEDYYQEYLNNNRISESLERLQTDQSEKERRIDVLAFQIDELESAKLLPNEDAELESQRDYLANHERINTAVYSSYEKLYNSERSVHNIIAIVKKGLEGVLPYDKTLEDFYTLIDEINIKLDDLVYQLRDYADTIDSDPNSLDKIESRLELIYRLKRKYGGTMEEMTRFLENAKQELSLITHSEQMEYRLNQELQESSARLESLASKLSSKRKKAAEQLEERIMGELSDLEMAKVKFKVSFNKCTYTANGADSIEFLIATNAGEPLKPLAKIASGGELSRIMLAIKSILADTDMVDTLIFDEIDTGISGRTAHKTAGKMAAISHKKQIICITHLAQIAAMANTHFLIQKSVENDKAKTNVIPLDTDGRIMELARIMGGAEITPLLMENAREMLGV